MIPPRISVVLAVYNGAEGIEASIRSVLEQSVQDLELIVIDDGSTDGTAQILAGLQQVDSRIVVVRQQNSGLSTALNSGIAMARGVYIARQDADDVSLPERFERQAAWLDAHHAVAALGTAADIIDAGGGVVGSLAVCRGGRAVKRGLMALRNTPVHGSMMMRRAALEATGGYRDAFRAGQDYDLWLRLSARFEIDNLPDVLYQWRLSAEGVYATRRAMQLKYAGIALAFARERASGGEDSYALLESCDGDLAAFVVNYRFRAFLHATWGELLFRGLGNSREVREHLRRAVGAGHLRLLTLGLLGWAHFGLPWPGGRPLAAPQGREPL
jgi:glycosyltransferase involved in cell wall biosynthesis